LKLSIFTAPLSLIRPPSRSVHIKEGLPQFNALAGAIGLRDLSPPQTSGAAAAFARISYDAGRWDREVHVAIRSGATATLSFISQDPHNNFDFVIRSGDGREKLSVYSIYGQNHMAAESDGVVDQRHPSDEFQNSLKRRVIALRRLVG
jgi:hypothetical protein